MTAHVEWTHEHTMLDPAPPPSGEWMAYFAHHSRSFRFAARFMPRAQRDRLARVYAYCRYTDDLVDRAAGVPHDETEARLDHWLELSRRAYAGCTTGIEMLDSVMPEMRAARVPFAYAAELIEGMRMDLYHTGYATHAELRVYTYRVAGVLGRWLTELFGVHDAAVLARAESLGHALQLTNILRDVGEDFGRGRVYLPRDRMAAHGVTDAMLADLCAGRRPMTGEFRGLMKKLLHRAESEYDAAIGAIPALPAFFARPVGVAAFVYRGIHREIRRSDYDTVRRRVYTSLPRKLWLGARGLSATGGRRASPAPSPTQYARRCGSA
jgi:phytoene synthase